MAEQQRISQRQTLRNAGLAAAVAAIATIATGGNVAVAKVATAFFTTFALSYGFSVASNRLQAKGWSQEVLDRRELIRSAVAPRRIIFGQVATSGVLVYAKVHGSSKEHLHLVVALAGHECHSIGDIWLDGQRIDEPDVNGYVTTGTFANLVRVKKLLGTSSQTADADLVSAGAPEWTTDHRGRGICYLYLRLTWDETKLPAIPTVLALVRGAMAYDPRDGATRFTENPALLLRHYFTATYGLGCASSEIDDTVCGDAADACEEWVALDASLSYNLIPDHTTDTWTVDGNTTASLQTGDRCVLTGTPVPTGLTSGATYYVIRRDTNLYQLATSYQNALEGTAATFSSNGSGTQTWGTFYQKRYAANGSFTLDQTPAEVEDPLRLAMAGAVVFTGGKWKIYAGAYAAPALTIGEDEILGTVAAKPRKPRQALVNAMRGTYTEPAAQYTLADIAPVTDATYVTQDGGETITRSLELAWVTNSFRAQRLAKIFLRRARGAQLALTCKITALRYVTAETVAVTFAPLGYSARVFRVTGWRLNGDGGGVAVELNLEEDAATVYDWAASEGIPPLVWTDPTVVDRFTVTAPSSLTLASGTSHLLALGDGTILSRIYTSWTAAADPNLSGYEVQWRKTTDADFYNSVTVPASNLAAYLSPVEDGLNYDVRVRALRPSGAKSDWATASAHTVVGKTAAPTAPTSLAATGIPGGVQLVASASSEADYGSTQFWMATTNDRSLATLLDGRAARDYAHLGLTPGAVRYYWCRFLDTSGNASGWYPSSATGGVSGTAGDVSLGTDAVDTINIVANAVTDITSAFTEATVALGAGSWQDVQSVVVATDGSPLAILGVSHVNVGGGGARSCGCRLRRDSTTVAGDLAGSISGSSGVDGYMTIAVVDTPAAGSYTYTLQLNPSGGAGADMRYLQVLETKR